jgi:hypothetical protein
MARSERTPHGAFGTNAASGWVGDMPAIRGYAEFLQNAGTGGRCLPRALPTQSVAYPERCSGLACLAALGQTDGCPFHHVELGPVGVPQ